jgi:hypothetical protein
MLRKWLLVLGFLILPSLARAQSTTVSGQVTDAGGQSWNSGSVTATFIPNPQYPTFPQYTWTGGVLNSTIPGTINGTGGYSLSLPSNTSITPVNSMWQLQFCPAATSSCFTIANITVTGATQTLNATPPVILIPAGASTTAYADTEVIGTAIGQQYYNITSGTIKVCQVLPCASNWVSLGAGGVPPIPFALTGTSVYARYLFRDGAGTTITDSSGNGRNGTIGSCVNGSVALNPGPAFGITATNANCSVTFPFNQSNYAAVLIYLQYFDPGNYMAQAAVTAGTSFGGMYQVLLGGTNSGNNNNIVLNLTGSQPGRQSNILQIQPIGGGTGSTSPDGFNGVGLITFIPGSPDLLYVNNEKVNSYTNNTAGSSSGVMTAGTVQLFGTAWGITGDFFTGTVIGMEFLTAVPTPAQITAEWQAFQSLAEIEGYFPTVATSQTNILNLTGSSIVLGQGITGPINYRLALPGPASWAVTNQGITNTFMAGSSLDTQLYVPQYLTPLSPWAIATNDGPTNDLKNGLGPDQALQDEISWCRGAVRAGFYAIASTTIKGNGIPDATVNTYNTLARSSLPTVCSDLMDWAGQPNLGADGAENSATWFQSDHTHPTQIADDTYLGPYTSAHIQYDVAAFGTNAQPNIYKVGNSVIPYAAQPDYACSIGSPGATTTTCAFPVPVTPGSTLGVSIAWLAGGPTISSVTDGPGDTFTTDHAACTWPSGANFNMVRYSAPNAVGGATTITVTFSTSAASSVLIFMTEDQRTATSSVVDVASACGVTTGNQATATSPSITTAAANEFLRASMFTHSANGISATVYTNPAAGWYQSNNFVPSSVGAGVTLTMNTQSKLARTAGAYTATLNTTPAAQSGIIVSALKAGTVASTLYLNYADCGSGWAADPSGGNILLNLPDATPLIGKTCNGENIQTTGANTVTIGSVVSGQTVNGTNTTLVIANLKHVACRSVLVSASAGGANWDCEPF